MKNPMPWGNPHFRSFSFILILAACTAHAQDHDLSVQGRITDAVTGEPIGFATLNVRDEADPNFTAQLWATANGEYTRELYTSAVWEGGHYVLEYTADGYSPRTATIDASNVEQGLDMTIAWRIDMDVELQPAGHSGEALPAHLGTCVYDPSRSTLRWQEKEARKAFPIKRYRDQRILAHATMIDSVSALDGVMLQGKVLSHWNDAALKDAQVRINTVGEEGSEQVVTTDRFGFYVHSLPFDQVHHITYTREDLVSKTLVIDLTTVPGETRDEGYSTTLDVRLFQPLPDEDLSFLDQPMGRMSYSAEENNLAWDLGMSKPILKRLDAILSRHGATTAR